MPASASLSIAAVAEQVGGTSLPDPVVLAPSLLRALVEQHREHQLGLGVGQLARVLDQEAGLAEELVLAPRLDLAGRGGLAGVALLLLLLALFLFQGVLAEALSRSRMEVSVRTTPRTPRSSTSARRNWTTDWRLSLTAS